MKQYIRLFGRIIVLIALTLLFSAQVFAANSYHGVVEMEVPCNRLSAGTVSPQFYTQLNGNAKKVYKAFGKANLKKKAVTIKHNTSFYASITEARYSSYMWENPTVTKIRNFVLRGAYAYMLDHMDKCYFIDSFYFSMPYEYKITGGRARIYVKKIKLSFKLAYNGVLSDDKAVRAKINEMAAQIQASRKSASRYDTLYAIAAYMTSHFSYGFGSDLINPQYHTIAGVALDKWNHTGVCDAYAKTFFVLCKRFGIPVIYVESETHAYNYVKMENGLWYGMDVTWIDEDNPVNPYYMDMIWFLYGSQDAKAYDSKGSHNTKYKWGSCTFKGMSISGTRYVRPANAA